MVALRNADVSEDAVSSTVFARIGLLGNPSDNCGGSVIACSIENFRCVVKLRWPSQHGAAEFVTHDGECVKLDGLDAVEALAATFGYDERVKLLQATCKMFACQCRARGVVLHRRGFRLAVETTIPRQAGLSGSSAIVCAAFNCLLAWHAVPEAAFPVSERPSLVLSVEQGELGIAAGLMDRVAQVYGGVVYADVSKQKEPYGCGAYEYLPADRLPPLFVIYADNPSDSGRVHAPVKQRWLAGDAEIVDGMNELALIAKRGRELLLSDSDIARPLASLLDRNFALRRRMYGDEALGAVNIDMIETASSVGAAAKFCGSGGAIVALCCEGPEQEQKLMDACANRGYICEKVKVADRYFGSIDGCERSSATRRERSTCSTDSGAAADSDCCYNTQPGAHDLGEASA